MCGIAGYIRPSQLNFEKIHPMSESLRRRGPDGEGQWSGPGTTQWTATFAHRRLAIIDLEGGTQPLVSSDGRFGMVFNGEIYNYRELRDRLTCQGIVFRTQSDTEVLLHYWIRYGVAGLADLRGMYAFAVWDRQEEELVLVRDPFGIKPLFYAADPTGVTFASEMTALLAGLESRPKILRESVAEYFFSDSILAPGSLFEGVSQLEPSSFLRWRRGAIETGKVGVGWGSGTGALDAGLMEEQFLSLLHRSVRDHLVADVPVGILLSGGLDSSAVAMMAKKVSVSPLQSFALGFDEVSFDESMNAERVASSLGLQHRTIRMPAARMAEELSSALDCLDQPLADPSVVPTFFLCREVAKNVKVVLSGDGGDELWGGYPTYRAHLVARWLRMMPDSLIKFFFASWIQKIRPRLSYQSLEWQLKRFFLRLDRHEGRRHLRWMSNVDLAELEKWMPGFELNHTFSGLRQWEQVRTKDWGNRFLELDLQTYLPGSVLTKVDRASMANGLEVRPPFLDVQMAHLAFSIPFRKKVSVFESKKVMRRSLRGLLPPEILKLKKRGFAMPVGLWLKSVLSARLHRVLQDSPLWDLRSLKLNRNLATQWGRDHVEGRADHAKPLWAVLVLDHVLRRLDGAFKEN